MLPPSYPALTSGCYLDESCMDVERRHSDTTRTSQSTGTHNNRAISALPDTPTGLLSLLPEITSMLCNKLSFRDIIALGQSCKSLHTLVKTERIVYKRWFFHRLPPMSQEKFRMAAKSLTLQEVESWVRRFSGDQQLIEHCRSEHGKRYFPEFLFYHMMRLKMHYPMVRVKKTSIIDIPASHGIFSPNGRHIIVGIPSQNMATICSINFEGQWEPKMTIPSSSDSRLSPKFSPDSCHVITAVDVSKPVVNSGHQCKIEVYDFVNDREWVMATTLSHCHDVAIESSFFNNYLILVSNDRLRTLNFYDLDTHRRCKSDPVSSCHSHVTAMAHSSDGLHGVTAHHMEDHGIHQIRFFTIADHNWLPEGRPQACDNTITRLVFSPDNRNLLAVSRYVAYIYGKGNDGWELKKNINHQDEGPDYFTLRCVIFSPDGRYVATVFDDCSEVKIYGIDGQWQYTRTIKHLDSVETVSFSPDNRHFATASSDCTARIYVIEENGRFMMTNHIRHDGLIVKDCSVVSADFSPDGSHLLTACNSSRYSSISSIKIYGMGIDGAWNEKGSEYFTDKSIISTRFSPDGLRALLIFDEQPPLMCTFFV